MRLLRTPATAPEWIARLEAADCSPADREAFEAWRHASARNAAEFARYERLCAMPRSLSENAEMFAELVAEVESPGPVAPTIVGKRRWAVPVALVASLASIAIATAWYFGEIAAPVPEYAAPASEQRTVKLADGSVVTLGTRSGISTAFTDRERRVVLPSGEAFFAVTKDPSRPFIVTTGGSEIRVVGTQFAVRNDGRIVEVIVREGHVEVVTDARASAGPGTPVKVALVAGKRLRFEPRPERVEVVPVDAEKMTAWRHGSIEFDDTTVDDAIEEMNRHFDKPIVLEDAALRGRRISGRFRAGDSESFVASLSERFDLRAMPEPGAVRLRRPLGERR